MLGMPLLMATGSGRLLADNDGPVRFHEVESWRGSFIASAHRYTSEEIIEANGQSRGTRTISYDSSIMVDFLLDEFEDDPAVWRGRLINPKLTADYRGVSNQVIDPKEGTKLFEEEFFSTSGPPEFDPAARVELKFHRERGWSFHFSTPNRSTDLTANLILTPPKGPVTRQRTQRQISATAESGTATLPYPAKGFILFAGDQKFDHPRSIPGSLAEDIVWEYTVYLEPASLEELKLEIEETDEYKPWRPETTPDCAAGTPLNVKAKVVDAKGGTPIVSVAKFVWELVKTSQEPGVAMNFPLDAKDERFDLELDAEGEYFVLENKNQRMTRTVRSGFSDTVKVVPYDWGGWSTLQVTAIMTDGRRIRGKLKGKSETGLRVPKRDPSSLIADSWKSQHKSGADNLDDEEVAGQTANGDGFTLYEEYRGFVENGKHISGDPKRKELFILNQIGEGGADAIAGIRLFERVSKLTTHHRLRETEMSPEARLLNGNHRKAPHRVDQHGVWMYNADGTGIPAGGTVGMTGEDAGRAFRPGRVNHVVIESPGVHDAIFGHARSVGDYKLSERDAAFAYDRAVAHELLHAVGVDHHGEGEHPSTFYFVSASDPNNPSQRAGFSRQIPKIYDNLDLTRSPDHVYDGSELRRRELETLLWEDTGRNIAEELAPLYERKLAAERAQRAAHPPTGPDDAGRRATQFPQYGKSEFYWRETDTFDAVAYGNAEFEIFATIGELNEADSGNELCLMRYYFATAYPVKDQTKTYYVVRPGQNRAGRSLCQSPAGTGANAPSHQPQSRFGDSAPNRGNCFGDICPNDDIPPRNLH